MLLKGASLERALTRPDPATRVFILGGPDESGSRALLARFSAAFGSDAECIDMSPARLREDPALLADEAAALGLFGERRWILVTLGSSNGDELTTALETLLAAPAAGNPVVVIGGSITNRSKISKLTEKHALAVLAISWPLNGKDAEALAVDLAGREGLRLGREAARAIVDATGGDRGLMAQEITKLALYRDAEPGQSIAADLDDWLAIGADLAEEDVSATVNILFDGKVSALPGLFAELEATGSADISLLRAIGRRALLLADLRGHVDAGETPQRVMATYGKAIFWKESDAVKRQLERWDSRRIGSVLDRLFRLERALKAPENAGALLIRAGLTDITRVGASLR